MFKRGDILRGVKKRNTLVEVIEDQIVFDWCRVVVLNDPNKLSRKYVYTMDTQDFELHPDFTRLAKLERIFKDETI